MKKYTMFLLPLALLLCGCGNMEEAKSGTAEVSGTETAPTGSSTPHIYACEDTTVRYESVSEFLESEFCKTMQEAGFTTYLPSYDKERYEFKKIITTANTYQVRIMDTQTDSAIDISITYDSFYEKPEDFAANAASTEGNYSTTAEKFGQTYDVYLMKTPYTARPAYALGYLPFEDYNVYISSHRATPEEVLEDFQAFDLVPAEEWDGA